jgi:acetyltransferase-like isoleucine patch superfamily enzyme
MFVNDLYPISNDPDWKLKRTQVERGVSVGNNATILPVVIGKGSLVGAGSVVTKDIPPHTVVAGNPAKVLRKYHERRRKV